MVTPVFEPAPERWFDVVLLIEKSDAMMVWANTIRDLQRLVGRHGAFCNVRCVYFSVGTKVFLTSATEQPVAPLAMIDPEGRRLFLILTHGTSSEWRKEPLIDFVSTLGKQNVVAMIQLLPQKAWSHTDLGYPSHRLFSLMPGSPNVALRVEEPISGSAERKNDPCYIPMLGLNAGEVATWARFVMSPKWTPHRGVHLSPRKSGEGSNRSTPSERLRTFRKVGTREAIQLLRVLSGVPLTLPIMQLVQQSLGFSRQQHALAEVMLSRLIERITPAEERVNPDQVFYDFIPEIREMLLGTHSRQESEQLDKVMAPLQDRLRKFVEEHERVSIKDFRALLQSELGLEKLPASARSFVEISRKIYEKSPLIPPATPPPVESTPPPPPEPPSSIWPIQQLLFGISVLWVDDNNPRNNQREITLLSKLGASVTTRQSTEEGLALISARSFDVILTDMVRGVQREAGFDLIRQLRQTGVKTPVLIYAGRFADSQRRRRQAIQLGAFACTNRPDELFVSLLAALGRNTRIEHYLAAMREVRFSEDEALALLDEAPSSVALALAQEANSVENLYQILLSYLDAISGCDYVQLFLGEGQLRLAASRIGKGKATYREASLSGVIGQAYQDRTTRWVPDVHVTPEYIPAEKSTASELAIPISSPKVPTGVVNFESEIRNAFTAQQIRWLENVVAAYPLPRRVVRIELIARDSNSAFKERAESILRDHGLRLSPRYPEASWASNAETVETRAEERISDYDCYLVSVTPRDISSKEWNQTLAVILKDYASSTSTVRIIPLLLERSQIPNRLTSFQMVDFTREHEKGFDTLLRTLQSLTLDPPLEFASRKSAPLPQPSTPRMKILVAGTGAYQIPQNVQNAALRIGRIVAAADADLIVGGWQGVDHLAAKAFTEELAEQDLTATDRLFQIVERGTRPDFPGGTITDVSADKAMTAPLEIADMAILIGGAGGTWQIFRNALLMNKPVIALKTTGSDAYHAAVLLEIFGQRVPQNILRAEFGTPSQAELIVRPLRELLIALRSLPADGVFDNTDLLWMTESILPAATRYLAKPTGYEDDAAQIFNELRSRNLPAAKREQLVHALSEDGNPSWRCVAYLTVESRPDKKFASVIVDRISPEIDFGIERLETRPLWRLLAATNRMVEAEANSLPADFADDLEVAQQRLLNAPKVDFGGECKSSLRGILEKLRSSRRNRRDAAPKKKK